MRGDELARQIRSRHPQVTVSLITAYSEAVDALQSEYEILHKPIAADALADALHRATRAG